MSDETASGAKSLWDESAELCAPHLSPFLMMRQSNACNIGVYKLRVSEVAPLLRDDAERNTELAGILAREYENNGAVVVTYSEEIPQLTYARLRRRDALDRGCRRRARASSAPGAEGL